MQRSLERIHETLLPRDFDLAGPSDAGYQANFPSGGRKSLSGMISTFVLRASWNYVLKPMAILTAFGWGVTWLFPSLLMGIGAVLLTYISGIDVNGLMEWASDSWKKLFQ